MTRLPIHGLAALVMSLGGPIAASGAEAITLAEAEILHRRLTERLMPAGMSAAIDSPLRQQGRGALLAGGERVPDRVRWSVTRDGGAELAETIATIEIRREDVDPAKPAAKPDALRVGRVAVEGVQAAAIYILRPKSDDDATAIHAALAELCERKPADPPPAAR